MTAVTDRRTVTPEDCLAWIKKVHRIAGQDEEGFFLCAECGKAHPCETYRSAAGDPNWPHGLVQIPHV